MNMSAVLAACVMAFTGAHALATGSQGCCFGLSASGGPGGVLGQISDGQNRIGQSGLPAGSYCIDNSGGLTDGNGHGCILTPPTGQFQCDIGASASTGFAVDSNGGLSLDGSMTFYSCPTGDHGGWNVYSQPLDGQEKCVTVTLQADNCQASASPAPVPATPTVTPTVTLQTMYMAPSTTRSTLQSNSGFCTMPVPDVPVPYSAPGPSVMTTTSCTTVPVAPKSSSATTPATKQTCPAELNKNFEFPHMIVHVDSANPDKVYGNSLNGAVTSSVSSLFKFDIPASDAGKQCTLEFLLPHKDALETSSYTSTGDHVFDFFKLEEPASWNNTWNNAPATSDVLGTYKLTPDSATAISTFDCPAGQAIGFWMDSPNGAMLNYFQDFNPCPIGLYINVA
ncbi:hypothetical protein LTR08_001665 [Meristemomyces frigidus]|nr:hypothetical protein LTR08_001665 [Meristemomyces frigidus]